MGLMFRVWLIWLSVVLLLLVLLSQQALAVVNHNVTFTVKNNGTVVASSDIGTFDASGVVLTIKASQMPAELRQPFETVKMQNEAFTLLGTVGVNIKSLQSPTSVPLDMSFRLKHFVARGSQSSNAAYATCPGYISNDHFYGIYRLQTDGLSFATTNCRTLINRNGNGGSSPMYLDDYSFAFLESIGGPNALKDIKIPAGVYSFASHRFQIYHERQPNPTVSARLDVKVTVVVEPSIAAVEMPASLPLDVTMVSGNRLIGQGTVTATVNGTLGKHLQIEPRSSNNGKLVKGNERIPYTLAVTPLSGDNKSRLLIDGTGSGNLAPVTIETFAKRDQYRLRFDAAFNVANTGLTSGAFNDSVTLIFTTPDMP